MSRHWRRYRGGDGSCHSNLFVAAFALSAEEKLKTASVGQQNQDYHGNKNRRADIVTATAVILVTGDAVNTLEADLET
jgi:hypothetical protein